MSKKCTELSLVKQFSGTCWANAVITALLYSDGMNTLLLRNLPNWKKTKAAELIRDILLKKSSASYDDFFEQFDPKILLRELHKENPKHFEHDPDKYDGYAAGRYLFKLMHYLGVDNFALLDALETEEKLVYDMYYAQYNVMQLVNGYKKFKNANPTQTNEYLSKVPDVLLIMTKKATDAKFYPKHYYKEKVSFKPVITYNGHKYVADSVILANFNQYMCNSGHEIAGVTCQGERYMYNGWVARTLDPGFKDKQKVFRKIPCALMKHDWLDMKKEAFCIDMAKCDLKYHNNANKMKNTLCFAYNKGPRNYVYIRADLLAAPAAVKPVPVKECPEGTILNPASGRCVSINGKVGKDLLAAGAKIVAVKTPAAVKTTKECPPDKVYNPASGRCVDKKGKVGKALLAALVV